MNHSYPADFLAPADPLALDSSLPQRQHRPQQCQVSPGANVLSDSSGASAPNSFSSSSPPNTAHAAANEPWMSASANDNPTSKLNSQLGGFRTRARAGTLPSRFNSSSSVPSVYHNPSAFNYEFFTNGGSSNSLAVPGTAANTATTANTASSSSSNLPLNRSSPLMAAVSSSNSTPAASNPSRDPFSDIFTFGASSATKTSAVLEAPAAALPPVGNGRRLRSGSLFGFDSSIWSTGSTDLVNDLNARSLTRHASIQQLNIPLQQHQQQHQQQQQQIPPQVEPQQLIQQQSQQQSQQNKPQQLQMQPQAEPQQQHPQTSPQQRPQIPTLQHVTQSANQIPQISNQALPDFSRIRSYTTTNALSEKQYHLPYDANLNGYVASQRPQMLPGSSTNNNVSSVGSVHRSSDDSTLSLQNVNYNYSNSSLTSFDVSQLVNDQAKSAIPQSLLGVGMPDNLRPRSQTYSIGSQPGEPSGSYYNALSNTQAPGPQQNNNNSAQLLRPHMVNQLSPTLSQHHPILVDNANLQMIEFTSTFQVSTLSPTNTILIMNLPPLSYGITTSVTIFKLASSFGKTNGVYVLSLFDSQEPINEESKKSNIDTINEDDEYPSRHDDVNGNTNNVAGIPCRSSSESKLMNQNMCAIVQFENIEIAMRAKAQLNHQELFSGYSCIVGFAKILNNQYIQGSPAKFASSTNNKNGNPPPSNTSAKSVSNSANNSQDSDRKNLLLTSEPLPFNDVLTNLFSILDEFGVYNESMGKNHPISHIIANAMTYGGFDDEYGPLPEPILQREFDAPKLREIRKLIDTNLVDQFEIESIALAMYDEVAELSSDYLGNTVVQKIFEISSDEIKDLILRKVAPYIAQMGIHKNGTWAGQKIINVADTGRQKNIIKNSLLPYVAPLFKDGFGNYLVQGCLKFGAPWNDFIFEAICSKFWVLAQDRYGSRAIRAVLESGNCTVEQTALLASLIVVYAEFLAIHNNGALLLTWYLDTCSLPNRHLILTNKILPWLVELSYNKLGSLTILKILNNRNYPEAGELILHTLYGSAKSSEAADQQEYSASLECLKQILKEFTYGPTFIHKTMSTPLVVERNLKPMIVQQIRRALVELRVTSFQQGYKRLMDEVGLTNKDGIAVNGSSGNNVGNTNVMSRGLNVGHSNNHNNTNNNHGENFHGHYSNGNSKVNRSGNNGRSNGRNNIAANPGLANMINANGNVQFQGNSSGVQNGNIIDNKPGKNFNVGSNNGNNVRYFNPLQQIVSPTFNNQNLDFAYNQQMSPVAQAASTQFSLQYNNQQQPFVGYPGPQNFAGDSVPLPAQHQQQQQQHSNLYDSNPLINQFDRMSINNNGGQTVAYLGGTPNMNTNFQQQQSQQQYPYNANFYR